tara:strand:- start:185 stop:697 length:513 start_codon:yes stop_codon:yes gene_type:complete
VWRVLGQRMQRLETVEQIITKYSVASSPIKGKIYIFLGSLFVIFAIIGMVIPGWPTVSWAVPAAFLFSLSNEKLFRWSLTNSYFGVAIFEYYATGKTIPNHAKYAIILLISIMTSFSAYFVWYVSTKGNGELFEPSSWNGADPGYGAATIIMVGIVGICYVILNVRSRDE